jgi:hypothetical protein
MVGVQNALYYGFDGRGKGKEKLKRVEKMYVDLQQFPFHKNPRFSTLMEIPQGSTWKIAENRALKWGSSPPRAEEKFTRAAVCSSFCDFLIDFGPKNR